MRNRVAVLHGVNLDALDRRPAEHYGGLTFTALEHKIARFARELQLETIFFHTNHEGEFVEGDAVDVKGPDGRVVAKGLVRVSAEAFAEGDDVTIHRDDLVLLRRV